MFNIRIEPAKGRGKGDLLASICKLKLEMLAGTFLEDSRMPSLLKAVLSKGAQVLSIRFRASNESNFINRDGQAQEPNMVFP